jgi:polyhydroxyalkanoate synthesis regulator protein
MSPDQTDSPILVKRYAGQRLYDPANQRYVSPEQLRDWVAHGVNFIVRDAETGADITQVLLA